MDEAHITEDNGIVAVSGAITFQTVSALYAQLSQVIENPGVTSLTIDFSGVKRIDSAAVTLLAGVRLCAQKQGRAVTFTGLNDGINSLVSLYGVGWVVGPEPVSG